MRIAYISLHWPRPRSSGIGRKIEEQISYWRQAGHTVQFFSHLTHVTDNVDLVPGDRFEYESFNGLFGKITTEINRCSAVIPLVKAVRNFSPDLIYLRWGMYVFPSYKIFEIAPVVVEINTNDVLQHKVLGSILASYNLLTRNIYLSRASGLVFVSNELLMNESFAAFDRPGVVIANGINLTENQPIDAPGNSRPRLGFIGTPNMAWHGVDKLVALARLCSEVDIDVIGLDNIEGLLEKPANLFFYGYLSKEKSREILSRVDVGLGTLALHRINMNEASVLKSREYLAYGIPIVIPYKDTDLEDLNLDTILKLPNTEDNIENNWMKIKDFAFQMKGRRVDREKISERISSELKEKARLNFFNDCISRIMK